MMSDCVNKQKSNDSSMSTAQARKTCEQQMKSHTNSRSDTMER